MAGTAGHAVVVRMAALMGAVLLTFTLASAERFFIPGLREATRAVPVVQTGPPRWRGRAKATAGKAAGGTAMVRLVRLLARWAFLHPHLTTTPALVGRPHGAYAASGLARTRRWATLGGHGRNGAG